MNGNEYNASIDDEGSKSFEDAFSRCGDCNLEMAEPRTFDELFDLLDILFGFFTPSDIEDLPSIFIGIELDENDR